MKSSLNIRIGLVEWVYSVIELPIGMIVGAVVYEGVTQPALQ